MPYSQLALEERYVIYHLVLYGLSYREIDRRLKRQHQFRGRISYYSRPYLVQNGHAAKSQHRRAGRVSSYYCQRHRPQKSIR